jgi:protein-tyrosine phosphatase
MHPTIIPLEGSHNFRDLGGYQTREGRHTRSGLIYRAGTLSRLTPSDLAQLAQLKLHSVFDLREGYEHDEEGHDQLWPGATLITLPTSLGREAMIAQLRSDPLAFRMADFYIASLAPRAAYHAHLIKRLVAQLEQPLVFHCSAGKDRTGIVAALLLRLVGVEDEAIIADYHLTETLLGQYEVAQAERFRGYGLPEAAIQELLGAGPGNMQACLKALDDQFGSAEGYLLQGGLAPQTLDRLRAVWLE